MRERAREGGGFGKRERGRSVRQREVRKGMTKIPRDLIKLSSEGCSKRSSEEREIVRPKQRKRTKERERESARPRQGRERKRERDKSEAAAGDAQRGPRCTKNVMR